MDAARTNDGWATESGGCAVPNSNSPTRYSVDPALRLHDLARTDLFQSLGARNRTPATDGSRQREQPARMARRVLAGDRWQAIGEAEATKLLVDGRV